MYNYQRDVRPLFSVSVFLDDTVFFVFQKEGPAPGNYEAELLVAPHIAVSSSFKSKTPRFSSSHTVSIM